MVGKDRANEIATKLDEYSEAEREFMLWYLLPIFEEKAWQAAKKNMVTITDVFTYVKAMKLRKASIDMRDILTLDLW